MRITQVEAIHLRLPEVREIADGSQEVLLVRIESDSGHYGLGEIVSCSYVARAVVEAPRSAPFRHGLAAIVNGMEVDDLGAIDRAMVEGTAWYGPGGIARHAMSGVDMALWDLRAKAAGVPVRRLLNANAVNRVPAYASVLWPDRPEQIARSARNFAEQGYRCVKYGWGPMGPDAVLDEELVAAARQALGDDIELMVDAGRAWDADIALQRAERFSTYRVFWLEEPLHPYDNEGYAAMASASPVPIAAGEAVTLMEEYDRLLATGLQVVQPDLGRVGGISYAQCIAQRAVAADCRPVAHAYGTGILLAASAQWAAAGADPLTEYTQASSPLARDLVHHTMEFRNGALVLDDTPGLGVALDPDVVARYRVS
ncbi:MAG: mandelate racemase/muconate lactonizing enzyme family protein [Candidatus Latescibacterota bacterium]|nr:mandelate racemase/muconate lactonizing enzyme family protein [Candidatus Latescibacterota bacterium]